MTWLDLFRRHHPVVAVEHALDRYDHAVHDALISLEHDVADGVHDAIFDEKSLLHEMHPDGTEPHVRQQLDDEDKNS